MIKLALKKSFGNWVEMGDGVSFKLDYPSIEQEESLQDILFNSGVDSQVRTLKYSRAYIKYTVKDWKGLPIECKLKNNELDNELVWALAGDPLQCGKIYSIISKELEVDETDKKK